MVEALWGGRRSRCAAATFGAEVAHNHPQINVSARTVEGERCHDIGL
ncbi:hypothetical protein KCP73_20800 [Salmonella enterica subsp. enterica]|nr:hypothetical protein KCP73_20800 [Salmonella enterica subsp. enterica]